MAVFWEWFHRNIGKTIGVIAILGTIYFFARGQCRRIPLADFGRCAPY